MYFVFSIMGVRSFQFRARRHEPGLHAERHLYCAGFMRAHVGRGAVVIVIEIRNYNTRILFLQVPETKTLIT